MDAFPLSTALRQEIDAIDGELHGLIRRRAALVGAFPPPNRPGPGLAAGPEARSSGDGWKPIEGDFPAAAFSRMWREMISAFTLMQTPGVKVAICRPVDQPGYWDLARDHFGCQIPFVATTRRPRSWPRCAAARPRWASCRRRSRPTWRRGVPARRRRPDAAQRGGATALPHMPNAARAGHFRPGAGAIEPEEVGRRPHPGRHRDRGGLSRNAFRRPGQGRPAASLRLLDQLAAACTTISSRCRACRRRRSAPARARGRLGARAAMSPRSAPTPFPRSLA